MEKEEITKNAFYCCKVCLACGSVKDDPIVFDCPICSSRYVDLYPSEYAYIKATAGGANG